jgi:hypothetical protein
MINPKSALLSRAASLIEKTAAPILWKYTDEDGKDFYLSEKRTGTVKSPYSGKSFTPKPTRSSLSDVGKDLKQDDVKVKGALWKYVDGEGNEFYLSERVTGAIKSPYSGKSFTPKAEKSTLSDVGKELKQDAQDKTASQAQDQSDQEQQFKSAASVLWKYTDEEGNEFYLSERITGTIKSPYTGKSFTPKAEKSTLSDVGKDLKQTDKKATAEECDLASEIIKQGESHPALAAIKKQYDAILEGVKTAAKRSAGVGGTEDPTSVLNDVKPEIEKLSRISEVVARQLAQRLTGSGKW